MKKIFVLGMLVGIVSVCGARAELVETVTTTESEVVAAESPVVVEPTVAAESVAEPVVVEETEVDEAEEVEPEEEEPEREPEQYPVPTEEIPD